MSRFGAGDRNRKITFQTSAGTVDDFGGQSESWSDVVSAWAAFMPVSDGEKWRAGKVEGRAVAWFNVDYSAALAAITTQDRLTLGGVVWSITGIKPVGLNDAIEFTAEKVD